jgi:hypothetical protein
MNPIMKIKYPNALFLIFMTVFLQSSCEDSKAHEERKALAQKQRELGDSISLIAQQDLLKNVSSAIQNGGPTNAIDFCYTHASEIIDSLSKVHQLKISRISSKYRNEANVPTDFEIKILDYLQKTKNVKDTLVVSLGKATYYKSILIGMPTCLKCHGNDKEIDQQTLEIINDRYPGDQAKGYKMGEFRGAWKIEFD